MKFYHNIIFAAIAGLLILSSCNKKSETADEVFYNGQIYSVDSNFNRYTAFAVKDGRIYAIGSDSELLKLNASKKTDLKGKPVYPGFHDGHCHFYGYGTDLYKIWLTETNSFEDVLDLLLKNRDQKIGGWLFGRGWDQNKWEIREYPNKSKLDSLFPDIPVFLLRVDGHAALVNTKALEIAGIDKNTKVTGGIIEIKNGELTGILIDKASDIVQNIIPDFNHDEKRAALIMAQKDCFSKGITFVTDAGIGSTGLTTPILNLIDSMHKSGELKIRINAMGSTDEIEHYRKTGKIKTENLSVHGFKLYADGALGSRGACLLNDYHDQSGHKGFLIYEPRFLDSIAKLTTDINFQLNTHCIGDSSHRLMLDIYNKYLKNVPNHRWRIEHAQVIHPEDLDKYKSTGIIPSIQPVHATSDMYWARERVGSERIRGAYAYNDLLKSAGMVISGSDFPVENLNPLHGFYAAVSRKDHKGFPDGGFQTENKMSRENTLRSFTIWPAYGSFRETESGSLEVGKWADFIILEKDIMNIEEKEIWNTRVLSTYIKGSKVYHLE
jgi:predicted amidohydrolase YtcJ